MASIYKEFRTKGQLKWIMKADGDRLTVYHDGRLIGTYSKRYIKNVWRKAFGYTMPFTIILAAKFFELNKETHGIQRLFNAKR